MKWEAEARGWPLRTLCADGLGAWPGRGWKWWGFEWGDSGVAALGVGRGEPWGLGEAGVSCPCPEAPASGSLLACSHPEATGTCGQSPRGRTGPTVPRRRSVHSGKSTFGFQHSLGRSMGHGTQHTISGHGPWGYRAWNPAHLQVCGCDRAGRGWPDPGPGQRHALSPLADPHHFSPAPCGPSSLLAPGAASTLLTVPPQAPGLSPRRCFVHCRCYPRRPNSRSVAVAPSL